MRALTLTLRNKQILHPTAPFHFAGTACKPSHFPMPVDLFKNGCLWFAMRRTPGVYGLRLCPAAGKEDAVWLEVYAGDRVGADEMVAISLEVRFRFGMDLDLRGFQELAKRDGILRPVVKRWRGLRPSCAFSLYELLCITIVLQNTQVSRSVKMLNALLGRFGSVVNFAGESLAVFWSPSKLAAANDKELRDLKVGYRAKCFLRVSQFFENHPDFEAAVRGLSKEAAEHRLRQIYGVGPATASYLLFDNLKHLDAFEHVSPWEQKILSRLLFRRELVRAERILTEARKRWGPWRMLAVHYLFEDLFWMRKRKPIDWLDKLIRL